MENKGILDLLQGFLKAGAFFLLTPLITATLVAADCLRDGNTALAFRVALTGVGIQLLVIAAFAVGYKIVSTLRSR